MGAGSSDAFVAVSEVMQCLFEVEESSEEGQEACPIALGILAPDASCVGDSVSPLRPFVVDAFDQLA
jgi:hypothetical protein